MLKSDDALSACGFLDEVLAACGQTVGDLDAPIGALTPLKLSDFAGDPDAVLSRPGARARFVLRAEKHRPAALRERIDGIDPIDVRAWPQEVEARARLLDAFRREVVELRQRIASPPAEADEWLPIDEAASKSGVSVWKVRKWPRRKREPLPVLGEDGLPLLLEDRRDSGRSPVKPFRVRGSDVRERDAKTRARAR